MTNKNSIAIIKAKKTLQQERTWDMKKKWIAGIVAVVMAAVCALAFSACDLGLSGENSSAPSGQTPATPAGKTASVYYLDVGQGDSELIQLPSGENILIDAGDRGTSDEIVSYLKEKGIKKIDLLIATHPHADHIGGMANVIQNFEIGKVYMPRVADDQTPTTKTYEGVLKAISDKNLKITEAKAGMTVYDAGGAKLEFLAPNGTEYKDLNNYSIVSKLTYGDTTFVFTGDAETESEKEILANKYDVKCDVLKLGHHGSSTSTSDRFLEAADPKYAVISCGVDNDYGHPHKETMNKLEDFKIETYRTDTQGTILATTDGKTVTMTSNQASVMKKES